ncbi:MAG: 6-phosphogluconolactonase [Candidatus Bathyarchaeia archaeon]
MSERGWRLHILPSAEEIARAAASLVADLAHECATSKGRFTIALSGGSTPRLLFQALALPHYADRMSWDSWHVFWGDERCVPPDNRDSNYRMAVEALLEKVSIPLEQIHRIRGEAMPHDAAKQYEDIVRETFKTASPSFDLILLGIGEDGHTASLFPDTPALREENRLVVANWAPHLRTYRVTFTLPLINLAKNVVFLATGLSKAKIVREILEPTKGETRLPAAMVRPSQGMIQWFVTNESASLLHQNHA